MFENDIEDTKLKKFLIWKNVVMGLCLLPFPLYLLDSYIQIRNYNNNGFTIIYLPDESLSIMIPFFFLFIFAYLGMRVLLEVIFLKHWDKSTIQALAISICAVAFISYMMVFVCGSMLAFSKDEINCRHIWSLNSKTYNWSNVDSIEVGAEKMPAGSKNSPYLKGTYNLHFKNGTSINLWGVYDGFIEHYKEIENIVEQNNIKVYKKNIDEETRKYIKEHYEKRQKQIIFQITD